MTGWLPYYYRYIMGAFSLGMLPVGLLLVSLFSFLLLGEAMEDVGSGSYSITDAIAVTLLELPRTLLDLMPVITLVGGLLGLGRLASSNEIVAMRASGLTPLQIAQPVFVLVMLLVALTLIMQYYLVPNSERQASSLRTKALIEAELGSEGAFWSKDKQQFLRVNNLENGQTPTDIEIYRLDSNNRLIQILAAPSAQIQALNGAERWILQQVKITTVAENHSTDETVAEYGWDSFLSPKAMATLLRPIKAMTPRELYQHIGNLNASEQNPHRYEMALWQRLLAPVGLLGMGLLTLPFVMGSMRTLSAGFRVMIGVAIGLSFYLLEQSTGQLALLLQLPPLLSVGIPQFAILFAALVALARIR